MIKFKVKSQKLELTETDYIANYSHNYLELYFDFTTDDWQDKTKYCLIQDNTHKTRQFPIIENKVLLPWTVLKQHHFRVSLYGVNNDSDYIRITTNQIRVKVAESGFTEDISPIDPDYQGDIITVILEALDTKVDLDDFHETIEGLDSEIDSINTTLSNKSDIGHTHTSEEVSGIDGVAEIEIKKAYNLLSNKIRTYGE